MRIEVQLRAANQNEVQNIPALVFEVQKTKYLFHTVGKWSWRPSTWDQSQTKSNAYHVFQLWKLKIPAVLQAKLPPSPQTKLEFSFVASWTIKTIIPGRSHCQDMVWKTDLNAAKNINYWTLFKRNDDDQPETKPVFKLQWTNFKTSTFRVYNSYSCIMSQRPTPLPPPTNKCKVFFCPFRGCGVFSLI